MLKKISNANVLMNSFLEAKKSCIWKNSVQEYEINFLKNIRHTQIELRSKSYKQEPFYIFFLNERGKERYIRAICFYDRVVQRTLCDFLLPKVTPYLIYDNGASLKGKGITFTRKRLENHLHKFYRKYKDNGYILLIDFKKFYDNICHQQLIKMYEKILFDDDILELINHLINTFSIDISNYNISENEVFDSLKYEKKNPLKNNKKFLHKSLGIGSQLSQISGIYYPTEIDNYCKIVKQMKYYGRYMDDIYIINSDRNILQKFLYEIEFICNKYGIFINHNKTQILKLDRGFTFLKIRYRFNETGHLIRIPVKDNFIREKRKLKSFKKMLDNGEIDIHLIKEQYKSWKGNMKKYDCHKIIICIDKLFKDLFIN